MSLFLNAYFLIFIYNTFLTCGVWFSNKCNNLDCHLYQPSFQYVHFNELFSETSPKSFSIKPSQILTNYITKKRCKV